MHRLFSVLAFITALLTLGEQQAFAHWPHQRVHRAIIDPLVTHHAVLEDELRVNFTYEEDPEDGNTRFLQEWEVAWALKDTFGVELFVPIEWFDPTTGDTTAGLGDMKFALKPYSYVGKEGRLVVTPQLNVTLPTGDPERKLGNAVTIWEPSLFVDKVFGEHVALQSNLELHFSTDRPEVEHHVEKCRVRRIQPDREALTSENLKEWNRQAWGNLLGPMLKTLPDYDEVWREWVTVCHDMFA